jgi:adenylosuccinate synthase
MFDSVATPYPAELTVADDLAIIHLVVLAELDELCICTAYELDGKRIDYFPTDAFLLERCVPIYEALPGFRGQLRAPKQLGDLPSAARRYVDRIAELLGLPVSIISVGPDRNQTIFCDE